MIPSYYRAWRVGHGTKGCQDRPRGLFSPEIRAVKSQHMYNFFIVKFALSFRKEIQDK